MSPAGAEVRLALAFRGGRLFVAGRTVDAANNWNFVVRAYQAGGEESENDDVDDDSIDARRTSRP